MLSFLKKSCKEKEVSSSYLENGSNLLEDLASASNCAYDTPFRNFSVKEIISATSNFREIVISDTTGFIYQGSFQHRLILVKRYRLLGRCNRLSSYINRDIVISLMMSHQKNVLRFLGCCLDFKFPVLVYEYTGHDQLLHDVLFNRKDCESLPWRKRLKVATDVANAIVYLHTAFSTPIVHRSLSTRNIIVDQFGAAKLLDFSLCISLPPGESQVKDTVVGVTGYLDPEYAMTGIVTEKTDVYMFGVLLLVLLTGKKSLSINGEYVYLDGLMPDPMEKDCLIKCLADVIAGERGETKEKQLVDAAELALRCIKHDIEDRPNMIDVAKELRGIWRSSS